MKRRLFSYALLLVLSTAVSAQQATNASLNYGFVSPNTRDDLTLGEAIRGMSSLAERNLLRRSRNMGCVVRTKIRATPALGSWSDGAEFSVLLRVASDESTVRYLMARLGRDASQKSVLYFHPQRDGEAVLYKLQLKNKIRLNTIIRTLDRVGIVFRTLVPLGKSTIVYVVDQKRELADQLKQAKLQLRAHVTAEAGRAEFVGNDTAPQARIVFEKEIESYEKSHPALAPPCH